MSDLKESHETIKQTTDDLKKQQDEMKTLLDKLNQEKNDWVKFKDLFENVFLHISLFIQGEKIRCRQFRRENSKSTEFIGELMFVFLKIFRISFLVVSRHCANVLNKSQITTMVQ